MNPVCPKCGGDALPIIYGYPAPGLSGAAKKGKVILGGCCVGLDDPDWRCRDRGHEWGGQAQDTP